MPNFIRGMAIDRMHGVDGGVVKKLLTLLFDVKYAKCNFSLYAAITVINARLTSIKPPKFIHRMPRTIEDLLHWKTSELKAWFFCYSIPIFSGVMSECYFHHYLCLVTSISILNADYICHENIEIARDLLNKYVKEFQDLFSIEHCSINVHQLVHLPDCVKNLGPLWAYTCYEYENLNRQLLQLIHGTGHIDTQIANSHSQLMKIPKLTECLPEGQIKEFCMKKKKKNQVKLIEKVYENCYCVGTYENLRDVPTYIRNAINNVGVDMNITVLRY